MNKLAQDTGREMMEARARVGATETEGSGQVAIWKMELMGLADG